MSESVLHLEGIIKEVETAHRELQEIIAEVSVVPRLLDSKYFCM